MKIIFLFVTSFLCLNISAQWLQTNGPNGGEVTCFSSLGSKLFVGLHDGMYCSSDSGIHWSGTGGNLSQAYIEKIISVGSKLITTTQKDGIYISNDTGKTWIPSTIGMGTTKLTTLAFNNKGLYVIDPYYNENRIYVSKDTGATWAQISLGWPSSIGVWDIAASGNTLFALTSSGLSCTTNDGQTWVSLTSGLPTGYIGSLGVSGSKICIATDSGLYLSINNGSSWSLINSELSHTYSGSILLDGSNLYIGCYFSSDNGTNWSTLDSGMYNTPISALYSFGNIIFAGSGGAGVFRLSNSGDVWISSCMGIVNVPVTALASENNNLYAGISFGRFTFSTSGVASSTNMGETWVPSLSTLESDSVQSLLVTNRGVFAGTTKGIFFCDHSAKNWIHISSAYSRSIYSLARLDTVFFAGTNNGVFISHDNGANWVSSKTGFANLNVFSLYSDGKRILAGTGSGLYTSTNDGQSWSALWDQPFKVSSISVVDSIVLIGASSTIMRSTDYGNNWNTITNGPPAVNFEKVGSTIFAGTGSGVYYSVDLGKTWSIYSSGLKNTNILSLEAKDEFLFAGTASGVWKTSLPSLEVPLLSSPPNSAIDQTTILKLSWNRVFVADGYFTQVSKDPSFQTLLYNSPALSDTFVTISGLLNSTTYYWRAKAINSYDTTDWSAASHFITTNPTPEIPILISPIVASINQPLSLNLIWSSIATAKVYSVQFAKDSMFTKILLEKNNLSDTEQTIRNLGINTTYYWRVRSGNTDGLSTWLRTGCFSTGIFTSLEMAEAFAVKTIISDTKIQYSLPFSSDVSLRVCDISGRRVFTFTENHQMPGHYYIRIPIALLSSGCYLYSFQAGTYKKLDKLLVMK